MSITLCDFCLILQKKSDAKWWEFLIKQSKQNTFTNFFNLQHQLALCALCNINLFRKSKVVAKNVAQVFASSSLSTLFNFLFDYNFNLSLIIESFFFLAMTEKLGQKK